MILQGCKAFGDNNVTSSTVGPICGVAWQRGVTCAQKHHFLNLHPHLLSFYGPNRSYINAKSRSQPFKKCILSLHYFKYYFHMEHKRSKKWPIFGEHLTPLCQATPHMGPNSHAQSSASNDSILLKIKLKTWLKRCSDPEILVQCTIRLSWGSWQHFGVRKSPRLKDLKHLSYWEQLSRSRKAKVPHLGLIFR